MSKIFQRIREDTDAIQTLPPALQSVAKAAWRIALRDVFRFCTVFAGLAWVAAALVR